MNLRTEAAAFERRNRSVVVAESRIIRGFSTGPERISP
jgi:hypothetical protein